MYTHQKQIITAGTPLAQAKGALVMLHGRGSTARNIISLAADFNLSEFAIVAPQATNQSWYPYSFMAPVEENQPALDSALEVIGQAVADIIAAGIPADKIYFAGFSQGACLTLEYIARNAQRFGGAVAFTGGLIGEELLLSNYKGDFANTPILITTGDPDPHVPLSRVEESVSILKNLGAEVTLKVFKGRPHTILSEEIELTNQLVFV
ncbi:alpha/beta hydrolase [Mucilaginibacter sp.]